MGPTVYQVTAKLWEHGWELHVDGLGVTQTRSLSRAHSDAADYIETMTGESAVTFQLHVELGAFRVQVEQLRADQTKLAALQTDVAARSRNLVYEFRGAGLTGEDIAKILGISPQRVSQLTTT